MSQKSKNKELNIINNLKTKKNNNEYREVKFEEEPVYGNNTIAHSSRIPNMYPTTSSLQSSSECSLDSLDLIGKKQDSQVNSRLIDKATTNGNVKRIPNSKVQSLNKQNNEVSELLNKLQQIALKDIYIPHKQLLQVNKKYRVGLKYINTYNDVYGFVLNDQAKQFYLNWGDMNNYYEENRTNNYLSLVFFEEMFKTYPLYLVVGLIRDGGPRLWFRSKIVNFLDNEQMELLLIDFGEIIQKHKLDCRVLVSDYTFPIIVQNVSLNLHFVDAKNDLFKAIVHASCAPSVGNVYDIATMEQFNNDLFSVIMRDKCFGVTLNNILTDKTNIIPDTYVDQNNENSLNLWDPMKEDFESERNDYHIRTDDALFAVTGYIPTDDKRYCKFEDKCRKNFCQKIHKRLDPNGVTTDKEEVIIENYILRTKILAHTHLTMIVTHVDETNLGDFYAQIVDNEMKESTDDVSDEEEQKKETLETLTEYLMKCSRSLDKQQRLKKIVVPPLDGHVVIVFYGGKYYRAKIIESFQDINKYTVKFLDYGMTRTVLLKDLRQMEGKFNWLPYQAVHFSIKHYFSFNIHELKRKYFDAYCQCAMLLKQLLLSDSDLVGNVLPDKSGENLFTTVRTTKGKDLTEYYLESCDKIFKANHVDIYSIRKKTIQSTKQTSKPCRYVPA